MRRTEILKLTEVNPRAGQGLALRGNIPFTKIYQKQTVLNPNNSNMKTTHIQSLIATALVGALASVVTTARADDTVATPVATPTAAPIASPAMDSTAATDADSWLFGVTVPLWAPQINGNATVKGHTADVNVNFSELKDHLDASFSLALNAQKGKFGVFGNFGYMKFSGGFNDRFGGNVSAQLKFVLANAGVSYQLVKTESEHPFILAGTVGVRYWYADTTLTHTDFNGNRDWRGGNVYDIYDPVIGLRFSQFITQKLHLDIAGDGGGFNLNNDTDWTWSA